MGLRSSPSPRSRYQSQSREGCFEPGTPDRDEEIFPHRKAAPGDGADRGPIAVRPDCERTGRRRPGRHRPGRTLSQQHPDHARAVHPDRAGRRLRRGHDLSVAARQAARGIRSADPDTHDHHQNLADLLRLRTGPGELPAAGDDTGGVPGSRFDQAGRGRRRHRYRARPRRAAREPRRRRHRGRLVDPDLQRQSARTQAVAGHRRPGSEDPDRSHRHPIRPQPRPGAV